MSKLADVIRRSQRVEAAPMGFGVARPAAKPSLLVGFCGSPSEVAAAVKAGADCLIIEAADSDLAAAKLKSLRAAADLPLGVLAKSGHSGPTKDLRAGGIDFLAFDPDSTPAAALLDEDTGYVLLLPDNPEELFLRSLDSLTLDAVYIENVLAPLSVKRQLELAQVGQLSHKTLICQIQADLSSEDLQCFRAAGAIVLMVEKAEAIATLKAAVAALPVKRQRKEDRPVVSLPRGKETTEDDDDDDDE